MRFGIYEVTESFTKDGLWKGYTCAATASVGRQGKLYVKSDGRDFYKAAAEPMKKETTSEDLEI